MSDPLQSIPADIATLVIDAVGVGVWERDLATGETRWNDQMFALTGVPRERGPLGADGLLAHVHPDDRAAVVAARQRAAAAGEISEVEYRFIRPDGTQRHLSARGRVVDEPGRARRFIGIVLDITASRDAERRHDELAQRLRLAAAIAGVGVWERDGRAERVHWDERTRAFFGVGADFEPTHEAWLLALHPDDRSRAARELEDAVAHADSGYMQFRIVRPDGETRHIISAFRIERDAQGRAARVLGVNVDATDTQRAAAESAALLERLQLAAEAVGLGIFEWDPTTDRTCCDDRFRAILGLPAGARPTYAEWIALVHPDDRERTMVDWQRIMSDGDVGAVEYRLVRADGALRDIRTTARVRRGADGRPLQVLGATLDVTRLLAAERAARVQAERARLTAETVGVGVYEWDAASDRTQWDAQCWRLFGHAQPQPFSSHEVWNAALHPDDRARVERELQAVVAGQERYETEYRVLWPDGSVHHLADRGVVHRDAAGRAQRLLGVCWDVTEARIAEAALRAKETAERANRAKSEFLSRMSHELRTPLNAILGFAQLLALDAADPPSAGQRERVEQIHAAGTHLLQLINDVLDLTRIETGRIAVSIETVALDAVIADALAMNEPELRRRGLALARERAADAPRHVWADRTRLKQVLVNLLSNAIKYNRPHGSVRVAVRRAEDGGVVIAVRDTGVGLAPEQVDKLFQPFNRLGLEHFAPEGIGIGLAISLRLVEQMGGSLEVSSEPGVGSEFRVRLQEAVVADEAPRAAPAELPALAARGDVQGAVLYIEDNPANSALVRQLLQWRPNVRLYTAPDGATGVVLAAVCRPDLVLIDLQLPDIHGTEVLRQLRMQRGTEELCCVAVSANATAHSVDAARSAGFADYWTKPLDAVAFLDNVDRHLRAAVGRALN